MRLSFELDFGSKKLAKKQAGTMILPPGATYSTGRSTPFIPFNSTLISGVQDNSALLALYNKVSEVNAIITYLSQVAASVPVKHERINNKGKSDNLGETDFTRLLEKPNPTTTGSTFTMNAVSSFFVFGNIFINKIAPVGFKQVKELYLMPGHRTYVKTQQSIGDMGLIKSGVDPRSNQITGYNWQIDQNWLKLLPEEVIHIKDTNLNVDQGAYLYGQSRLYSAIRTIEGLSAMVDTINTILKKNGGLGFLKKNKKPNEIDNVIPDSEKKAIEARLLEYGFTDGRSPIWVTDQDLQYVKIASALSEFMPTELKMADFRALCNVLGGLPSVLLNDTAASTYDNVNTAQKGMYSNIIIPVLTLYYNALSEALLPPNEYFEPDFDDIEALQKDAKLQAETNKTNDEVQKARYNDNLITLNQWLESVGLQPIAGGDKFQREVETGARPLASDLGVGGVQALQAVLADTAILPDQKVYILMYVFGIDQNKARQMAGA